MRKTCLFTGPILSVALITGSAFAQDAPPASPAPNNVAITGNASAICWTPGGATWAINGTNATGGGGTFAAGTVVTIGSGGLVDANNRAAASFAVRARMLINCNAPLTATLTAQQGRFRNTSVPTLPAGLTRTATASAAFENSYPYFVNYGLLNTTTLTVDGAGNIPNGDRVNGPNGYLTNLQSGPAGTTASPNWGEVASGSQWATLKRLDVRLQVTNPPNVAGQTVRPVMIAGSYSEVLTVAVNPSL
jgi:hypothetical protein